MSGLYAFQEIDRKRIKLRGGSPGDVLFEERLARLLLIALLGFMPLAFGAVEAWSESIVLAASAGLLACLGIRAWRNRAAGGLRPTAAYLPVGLFILLAFIQIVPLPMGLLSIISPHAHGVWIEYCDNLVGSTTLSLYPHATWHDLRLVLIACAVLFTVIEFFRRTAAILNLLLCITLIGAALAVLALLQDFFGNGRFYWIGPSIVQTNSGTFVCHNHFSQHMTLCVMAMLAYAMVRAQQILGGRWLRRAMMAEFMSESELRGARWALVFAVIGLVAIAMSTSRMGVISAGAGVVLLCGIIRFTAGKHGSGIPMLVGIAALCAIVLGSFEGLAERMQQFRDLDVYQKRWTVVADLVPAVGHYFLTGSGLGTFSVVYPMYDMGTSPLFASHAENEYAQLLLEMGIPGAIFVGWFLVILARAAIRAMRRMDQPVLVAAPALVAGLVAVMVHSWSDFGQHLPAVAGLSAVFCGLLIVMGQRADHGVAYCDEPVHAPEQTALLPGVAASRTFSAHVGLPAVANPGAPGFEAAQAAVAKPPTSHVEPDAPSTPSPQTPERSLPPTSTARWLPQSLLAMLTLLVLLNIPSAFRQVFAQAADAAATALLHELETRKTPADDERYATMVRLGQDAVDFDPGEVRYRYRLGVYRWRAAIRGRTKDQIGPDVTPELGEAAGTIVDEMILAAARCPTFGPLHCWRGQMERWVLGDAAGSDRVEMGIRTSRNDPIAWFAAAQVAAADGQPETAFDRVQRAVDIRKGDLSQANEILAIECKRPDLLVKLAGDDPQRLYQAADWLLRKGFIAEAAQARSRSITQYRKIVDNTRIPAAALVMLAQASSDEGDHETSLRLYRQALAKEYLRNPWRLACIEEMLACGKLTEAERELQVADRLKGDVKTIRSLRSRLYALQGAATNQPATQQAMIQNVSNEAAAALGGDSPSNGTIDYREFIVAAVFLLTTGFLVRTGIVVRRNQRQRSADRRRCTQSKSLPICGNLRQSADEKSSRPEASPSDGRTGSISCRIPPCDSVRLRGENGSVIIWIILGIVFFAFSAIRMIDGLNIVGYAIRQAAQSEGIYQNRHPIQYMGMGLIGLVALVGISWIFPRRHAAREHWPILACTGLIAILAATRFVSLHLVDVCMKQMPWLLSGLEILLASIVMIGSRRFTRRTQSVQPRRRHRRHNHPVAGISGDGGF